MKANIKIRKAALAAGVPLWQVAGKLEISESTFHRWMRTPLPKEKERNCLVAIEELEQEVDRCRML